MRKFIIIVLIFSVLSILGAGLYFWVDKNQLSDVEKAKENTLSNILKTNKQGDALIIDEPEYQIIYHKGFDQFMISILRSPFEDIRKMAEEKFLEITKANENIACQLDVVITTPFFANPDLAGQKFYLSFCQESK